MKQDYLLDINNVDQYSSWKQAKLANLAVDVDALRIEIKNPFKLREIERQKIIDLCDHSGMAIYSLAQAQIQDKNFIRELGMQIGLQHLDSNLCADNDSITSLQTREEGRQQGYIPYTSKRLNWHTDGYYNDPAHMVRGIVMHCVRAAETGGENCFLDPELLYLHLRDINPDYIVALAQNDAMSIPPNVENGEQIRDAQTGPVFSLDKVAGRLHMRYTARTRSINWKNDPVLVQALKAIETFLQSDSDWIIRYRLQPGEGIICNNVLHNRSAFEDNARQGQGRLLYRARFYERVAAKAD